MVAPAHLQPYLTNGETQAPPLADSPPTTPATNGEPAHPPLPTSHLPALSPADESLLETFIALRFNLEALAESRGTPLLHLVRWLDLPHIHEHLEALDRLRSRQRAEEAYADRRAALEDLKQQLSTTQDPIERRRAATTILRTANATLAAPAPHSQHQSRDSRDGNSDPRPYARPSPALSAAETVNVVCDAFLNFDRPDENSALATLHAFCAKGAVVNGKPVHEALNDFIRRFDAQTARLLRLQRCVLGRISEPAPDTFRSTGIQLIGRRTTTLADIDLRRESPAAPILITNISFRDPANTS